MESHFPGEWRENGFPLIDASPHCLVGKTIHQTHMCVHNAVEKLEQPNESVGIKMADWCLKVADWCLEFETERLKYK